MFYRIIILLFLLLESSCFAAKNKSQLEKIKAVRRYVMEMKLKKDSFCRSRGGNSEVFEIICACCNEKVMYYQKDGFGRLLRCYLDRIIYPYYLEGLAYNPAIQTKKDMPLLECCNCHNIIGTPMFYKLEKRLAFRMNYGTFYTNKIKEKDCR